MPPSVTYACDSQRHRNETGRPEGRIKAAERNDCGKESRQVEQDSLYRFNKEQ